MPSPARLLAALALSAGLLGCSTPAAPRAVPMSGVLTNAVPASAEPSGAVTVATAPVSVRYTFDAGVTRPITDEAGAYELRPLGQNTGTLSLVQQNGGLALQYPARCTLPDESQCPRAILEGTRDDALNPGTRPLQYGASIRMTPEDLADGANVFQKGYSVGGSTQFKLQVDHKQGHPSCVIAGPGRIYKAEPKLNVADGAWHNLACGREGNQLTLTVDGTPSATVEVPADLSIANAAPLRVGGKGPASGNDQYAGQIDNVFLTIG
jgi:concanavalin A-like lectin/glucanase superfamily protein